MLAHVKALSLIFWHRHRIGLSAVIVSIGIAVALAWISRLTLSERWMPTILAVAVLPFFSNALYLIAVFVFGFDSDVNQSGSCYPRSFFTLPISTLTLAFIPTLLVAVSLSLLWFILARLILAPLAIQVPLLWPMLLIANIVMAVQIIFWWPFRNAWGRLVAGILFGHLPASTTLTLLQFGYSLETMVSFIVACFVAESVLVHHSVQRARSNRVATWQLPIPLFWPEISSAFSRSTPFSSAFTAQCWYETKRMGFVLPFLAGITAPLCLLTFFDPGQEPFVHFRTVLMALMVPIFFAGMGASSAGEGHSSGRDAYGLSSQIATRPLSSAALLGAKLIAASKILLFTWAIVISEIMIALYFSGNYQAVGSVIKRGLGEQSLLMSFLILGTAGSFLFLICWKRFVENMLAWLTGREWVVKGSILLSSILTFLVLSTFFLFLLHPADFPDFPRYLQVILPILVASKLLLGTAIILQVIQKKLLTPQTLWIAGSLWLAIVMTASAVLLWGIPPDVVPPVLLVSVVILMTPFARLAATPLALDWNRHR